MVWAKYSLYETLDPRYWNRNLKASSAACLDPVQVLKLRPRCFRVYRMDVIRVRNAMTKRKTRISRTAFTTRVMRMIRNLGAEGAFLFEERSYLLYHILSYSNFNAEAAANLNKNYPQGAASLCRLHLRGQMAATLRFRTLL